MPLARRITLAGYALSTFHLLLAGVGVVALGSGAFALYFGLCGALTVALTLMARPLLRPRPGGGPGPRRGEPEPDPPPWWPEFETRFWAHVRAAGPRRGGPRAGTRV